MLNERLLVIAVKCGQPNVCTQPNHPRNLISMDTFLRVCLWLQVRILTKMMILYWKLMISYWKMMVFYWKMTIRSFKTDLPRLEAEGWWQLVPLHWGGMRCGNCIHHNVLVTFLLMIFWFQNGGFFKMVVWPGENAADRLLEGMGWHPPLQTCFDEIDMDGLLASGRLLCGLLHYVTLNSFNRDGFWVIAWGFAEGMREVAAQERPGTERMRAEMQRLFREQRGWEPKPAPMWCIILYTISRFQHTIPRF